MAQTTSRRRGTSTRRNTGYASSMSTWRSSPRASRTFGSVHGSTGMSYGNYGYGSGSSSWGRPSATRSGRSGASSGGSSNYRTICANFEQKINSYKTLCNQATGPANASRPSPTTLNSFAKLINKGAVIQCVSPSQVTRWSGSNRRVNSATTAKNVLSQRFGRSCIKAVTCDKSGGFLVATAATRNGKTFKFPQW